MLYLHMAYGILWLKDKKFKKATTCEKLLNHSDNDPRSGFDKSLSSPWEQQTWLLLVYSFIGGSI